MANFYEINGLELCRLGLCQTGGRTNLQDAKQKSVEVKKAPWNQDAFFLVDRLGFEPRQAEPKSAVLPLHHRSILF